eukprot:1138871-Pelagomonas_calceolata.AAC.4
MLGTNSSILHRVVQENLKLQHKDDLRYRLRGVWREAESADSGGNKNKLATYQACFATPFTCIAHETYVPPPWYHILDSLEQVMHNLVRSVPYMGGQTKQRRNKMSLQGSQKKRIARRGQAESTA